MRRSASWNETHDHTWTRWPAPLADWSTKVARISLEIWKSPFSVPPRTHRRSCDTSSPSEVRRAISERSEKWDRQFCCWFMLLLESCGHDGGSCKYDDWKQVEIPHLEPRFTLIIVSSASSRAHWHTLKNINDSILGNSADSNLETAYLNKKQGHKLGGGRLLAMNHWNYSVVGYRRETSQCFHLDLSFQWSWWVFSWVLLPERSWKSNSQNL